MVLAKNIFWLLLGFAIVFFAYMALNISVYGKAFQPLIDAGSHVSVPSRNLQGLSDVLLFYPYVLVISCNFLAFSIFSLFASKAAWERLRLPIFLFAAFYFFFSLIPHKMPRFGLLMLPFIAILAVVGFFELNRIVKPLGFIRYVPALSILFLVLQPLWIDYNIYKGLYIGNNNMGYQEHGVYGVDEGYGMQEGGGESIDYKDNEGYAGFFKGSFGMTVLSTDPVHAAISDIRLIHIYDNPDYALEAFKKYRGQAEAVVFNRGFYPCADRICEEKLDLLELGISSRARLVADYQIDNQSYYIYFLAS